MSFETLDFRGQPAVRLALPSGDACVVALHGAHLLSWTTGDGVLRLYLSPKALFDGHSAIRGGVPLCWPQFNTRGALPKHGFVRNVAWEVDPADPARPSELTLTLADNDATRAIWPHAFRAQLTVTLAANALRVALSVHNTGADAWAFTGALHSYLRVDDIADVRLEGLQGMKRWDAVRDERHVEAAPALRFDGEFDSVYVSPAHALRLVQPAGVLQIAQSASCPETVVWNPGAALSSKLADMPDDGYRHMLCVEAASIDEPVLLAPGGQWQGWQQLTIL